MNKEETLNNTLIIQWQICVEMANIVSQRRDSMKTIFISLNLAIVTAISVTWDIKSTPIIIAGLLVCALWMFLIKYYRQMNQAKFEVINRIEEQLSFRPYKEEWDILKRKKSFFDGTKLEMILPILFILLYIALEIIINLFKTGGNT